MVDYPMFFPLLFTLTWDTFLTLRKNRIFLILSKFLAVAAVGGGPKILVSAPFPLELIGPLNWVWGWALGVWGQGLTIYQEYSSIQNSLFHIIQIFPINVNVLVNI